MKAILPLLFKLSIPGIVSMTIQALYNVVDSFFVARISENALTALSIAFPVHLFLIAISVGTGVGTSSFISRLLGQNKKQDAMRVAQHVLTAALIYGVITAISGIFIRIRWSELSVTNLKSFYMVSSIFVFSC
jgi:Na+-driven multidrug efflux pump